MEYYGVVENAGNNWSGYLDSGDVFLIVTGETKEAVVRGFRDDLTHRKTNLGLKPGPKKEEVEAQLSEDCELVTVVV